MAFIPFLDNRWQRTLMSTWADWTSCSVTCGPGRQLRLRKCYEGCDDVKNEDLEQIQKCYEVECSGVTNFLNTSNLRLKF